MQDPRKKVIAVITILDEIVYYMLFVEAVIHKTVLFIATVIGI